MEINVKSKYLKISPRKLRLAVNLVRGKNLIKARDLLSLCNNKSARMTGNLINSAIAIVKESDVDVDKFIVKKIVCSDGPRLKRGKPASKGSMMPITKRQSHLHLLAADTKEAKKEIKNQEVRDTNSNSNKSKEK